MKALEVVDPEKAVNLRERLPVAADVEAVLLG